MLGIPQEQVGDLTHHLFVDVSRDTEIHQTDPAVGHDDRVGGMGVGMEKAEFHQLA